MFDTADVVVVVLPARVPTRSVGEKCLPPDSIPYQRANSRWRWFVLSPMSPRTGDTAARVFQDPCQPIVNRAPSAPGSFYPVWDARLSMLDCHLVEGVWYIYDWDTGWFVLIW